jgi:hypothetical protein
MFYFRLAQRLGRTVGELLYGSPSHRPISSMEITEWIALDQIDREMSKN